MQCWEPPADRPLLSQEPGGACRFRLEHSFSYLLRGCVLTVPAGYTWDLASVPRALWWAVAPFSLGDSGPLLHDYLYGCEGVPPPGACLPHRTFARAEADALFLREMERDGIPWWRRRAAYLAVRAAGWAFWRRR